MERKALERRTVLKGGAAAFGMIGSGVSAATIAAATPAAGEAAKSPLPEQLLTAVERRPSSRILPNLGFRHAQPECVVGPGGLEPPTRPL
jgi:hypothetical protein